MTTADIERQKLLTQAVNQQVIFDFTTIGRSGIVYLIDNHTEPTANNYVDSLPYRRIDFQMSGLRSDLTGQIAEPSIVLASQSLWDLTEWQTATNGMGLMDYRGVRVIRYRQFYNTSASVVPQVYYIKQLDELNPESISFTLTPNLGGDNLNQPSARKLEL
jgi:hypothetical protein